MQLTALLSLTFLLAGSLASAQEPGRATAARPITLASGHQAAWGRVKGYINNTAKEMPENAIAHKPGYNRRSFGEVLGHIADARFNFCAAAQGVPNPNKINREQTAKSKADALKALADSEVFCDLAFASLTDASFAEMVTPTIPLEDSGTAPIARGSILTQLLEHDSMQYGYSIVYLRSIVPAPSSPGRATAP